MHTVFIFSRKDKNIQASNEHNQFVYSWLTKVLFSMKPQTNKKHGHRAQALYQLEFMQLIVNI